MNIEQSERSLQPFETRFSFQTRSFFLSEIICSGTYRMPDTDPLARGSKLKFWRQLSLTLQTPLVVRSQKLNKLDLHNLK